MTPFSRMAVASIPFSVVVVLSWFGVFTFVNGYCIKQLGYSNAEWTTATLWFTGALIFWQIICTEISRWIGRLRTITLSLASGAAGYGVITLTGNQRMLLHGGLVLIAGVAAIQAIVWLSLVAEIGRQRPGRALAVTQIVSALVAMSALISGGYLLDRFSYRLTFLIFTLLSAGCCGLFYYLAKPLETGSEEPGVSLFKAVRYDLRHLITVPFIGLLLLGAFIEPFNFHTANQLFPNLMRDRHAWTEMQISIMVALGRLPGVGMVFLIGHFIDRLSAPRWYGIGLLMGGLSVIVCGLATPSSLAVAAYLGYFTGQGLVWASNMAATNSVIAPRLREVAFAIFCLVMNGSIFMTGYVHNFLLGRGFSIDVVFAGCGLFAMVGACLLMAFSCTPLMQRGSGSKNR